MNYYERHVRDWITDTVGLSMIEDGAYNRLVDQCYQTERPLPNDIQKVYKLARAKSAPERRAVDSVLESFFNQTAEGFVQKRVQREIARYASKQTKAKASAAASVKARREKAEQSAQANSTNVERTFNEAAPNVQRPFNGRLTNQTPDTKHQTPKEKKTEPSVRQKKLTAFPDAFEITETHQRLAEKFGLKLQAEFEHFRDHAKASARTQADWSLAFCVWLRNANKFSGKKEALPIDYEALKNEADARELEHAQR